MLTERQQQLVGFLRSYQRTQGVMPSTRDIQQHFGFASQTAAMSHLKALERKPNDRFPNARAMYFALRPFIPTELVSVAQGLAATGPRRCAPSSPPSLSRWRNA